MNHEKVPKRFILTHHFFLAVLFTLASSLSLLVKEIGIFALFLIILFLLYKSSRNWVYIKGFNHKPSKIQVKGIKILGPKKSLFLVEVLGHILLLGVTERQITVLLDLPRENLTGEQIKLWNLDNNYSDQSFKKFWRNLIRK